MPKNKDVKTRIQNQYPKLPQRYKILTDYFIENFDKIPFLTVQEISAATSLSVASVVPFAQRIGFKGFLEMRDKISGELQNRIHNRKIFSLFAYQLNQVAIDAKNFIHDDATFLDQVLFLNPDDLI